MKQFFFSIIALCASTITLHAQSDSDKGINYKDQVIADDLIVTGSTCVGLACVNGIPFGETTLLLKEDNLRILFQDESSTASFPSNDWQITINDSQNGGLNKFSIDDITGSKTPFTIEANAKTHALYIDDGGRIGIGTNNPTTTVHLKGGNSPGLRIEQDGSSGFTPQIWDVVGNETNFFIRDATNGSNLPFRILNGAPNDALVIAADGYVGLGTVNPSQRLHVVGNALITGELETTSDLRLKDNISLIKDANAQLNQLRPVQYKMKHDLYDLMNLPTDLQYGLIAQEVKDILPSLVSGIEGDINNQEVLSVNYLQIVPLLIKANQEQHQEIQALKAALLQIQKRLDLIVK